MSYELLRRIKQTWDIYNHPKKNQQSNILSCILAPGRTQKLRQQQKKSIEGLIANVDS